MQMSIIGKWLMDGSSPHTGQLVLEICRIVKPEHGWLTDDANGEHYSMVVNRHSTRVIYRVGNTYAIQPGRGKKAIGRTPPIASIRRQDVRDMTDADALARGFLNRCHYLQVWCEMHDPLAVTAWRSRGLGDTCGDFFDSLRGRGKSERYDAWVIRFAAHEQPPGLPPTRIRAMLLKTGDAHG